MAFKPLDYYKSMFNNEAFKTLEGLPHWDVNVIDGAPDESISDALFEATMEMPQILDGDDGEFAFVIPNDTFERLQNKGQRFNSWHAEEAGELLEELLDLVAQKGPQIIVEDYNVVIISQKDLNDLIAKASAATPRCQSPDFNTNLRDI